MAESGLTKFAKILTGGEKQDGWGVSTSGLVIFLFILIVATAMLIVNGVYFFKVYNGSTDEDMNNYWSRGGSLALAIINVVFAVLLGIEFFIILKILITRSEITDPSCIKAIGGAIGPDGLPNATLSEILSEKDLAFASGNPDLSGYVTGVKPGRIPSDGVYIGSEKLKTSDQVTTEINRLRAAITPPDGEAITAVMNANSNIRDTEGVLTNPFADPTDKNLARVKLPGLYKAQMDARNRISNINRILASIPPENLVLRTDKTKAPPVDYVYYPYGPV
jgi:hypothetical protein